MRWYDESSLALAFFAGAILLVIAGFLGLTPRWIRDLIAPEDGSKPEGIDDEL